MQKLGIRYGLICSLVYIIGSLVNNLMSSGTPNQMMQFLVNIVMFGVTFYLVYIAIKEWRESEDVMSAGKGLKMGVLIGLIAGVVASVFSLIYWTVIEPDFFEKTLAATEDAYIEQGMSDEQIEQILGVTRKILNPVVLIPITIIWVVFWGLIKGAISGSILKKAAEPDFAEE